MKINIAQCLKAGVNCSLYVDDFQNSYISSKNHINERQLQLCLNNLQQWSTDNGFRFSKKTGLNIDPQNILDKRPIPVVEETTFYGVVCCMKLSYVPHLKYVKKKGLKTLNILNVIGNNEWRADCKVMLRLYRSLVRSKLEYEFIVYGSARKSYLKMMDPVHNQGLRRFLAPSKTSHVENVYVDAHEPCWIQDV